METKKKKKKNEEEKNPYCAIQGNIFYSEPHAVVCLSLPLSATSLHGYTTVSPVASSRVRAYVRPSGLKTNNPISYTGTRPRVCSVICTARVRACVKPEIRRGVVGADDAQYEKRVLCTPRRLGHVYLPVVVVIRFTYPRSRARFDAAILTPPSPRVAYRWARVPSAMIVCRIVRSRRACV